MNEVLSLGVLMGIFYLSVKASLVFRMTVLQRKVLYFLYFLPTESVFCAVIS